MDAMQSTWQLTVLKPNMVHFLYTVRCENQRCNHVIGEFALSPGSSVRLKCKRCGSWMSTGPTT